MSTSQKEKDLKKRIEHLDIVLLQKKALVENEMLQIENLCKELIKLHEQYNIITNQNK